MDGSYKLCSESKNLNSKSHIVCPPRIDEAKYSGFAVEDIQIKTAIDNFIKVLEREVSKDNLNLLYNNLKSLEVISKTSFVDIVKALISNYFTSGLYYPLLNRIKVIPNKIDKKYGLYIDITEDEYLFTIYHELLHMSSTLCDEVNDILFGGFCQYGKEKIGFSLDEGYTELLTYRYFIRSSDLVSYKYETNIMLLIEKIIGRDKLTSLYFNADLYGLCLELKRYVSNDEIKRFILYFDNISRLSERTGSKVYDKIVFYHEYISLFLIRIYVKKLACDIENKKITNLGYDKKINEFTSILHKAFTSLELEEISKGKSLSRKK